MHKFAIALSALALGAAAPAMAQTQVYTAPSTPAGNQTWTGSLGLDFTVNSVIHISALGSYDAGLDGVSNIWVGIYTASGTLVSPLVNLTAADGVGVAGNPYVFQSVTPFVLGPGNYQLAAWGYGGTDPNYNAYGGGSSAVQFNSLGGFLTATGTHYNDGGVTGFANGHPDDGVTRYGAGSFLAAVPEPGTWAMMVGGFGLLGFAMRGRKREALQIA